MIEDLIHKLRTDTSALSSWVNRSVRDLCCPCISSLNDDQTDDPMMLHSHPAPMLSKARSDMVMGRRRAVLRQLGQNGDASVTVSRIGDTNLSHGFSLSISHA